ncbi:lymphocyte antigen 6H-like [Molossus molossus]|uniref:Lymphocyte antigen 6 family member G6E n=1 Tax=Molossus molossus TaxID=27622 RepID=A0A7J8BAJ1_MOLMO|nr:lymphocyte antigen 6H-like [Molossus molossus]KAF6395847.1 hypothetical protein HJG59_011743 [Molossus molossus]
MRGLHLILLMALLCSDRALSLQCYSCHDNQCGVLPCIGVCFKSHVVFTLAGGQKTKSYISSCAPSCEFASNMLQNSVAEELSHLHPGLTNEKGQLLYTSEVQGLSCCGSDLCNGVAQVGRSFWVFAGGLLLSLGPAVLWTL